MFARTNTLLAVTSIGPFALTLAAIVASPFATI